MRVLAGFALPCAGAAAWLAFTGALAAHLDQVWRWGWAYASTPPSPPSSGLAAVLNWAGFHAALVVAAGWFWAADRGSPRLRLLVWVGIALAPALVGARYAPRYFTALLAALAIPAARGMVRLSRQRWALAGAVAALAIPAARFGPRYFLLAAEAWRGTPHAWADVAMDQESRRAAEWLRNAARPGDTVFVWGYRPNVVVYTRLPVASRYWDSQPVTGVPADRHLRDARPILGEWAANHRRELARSRPTFIVDGLSAYNPALEIRSFADLGAWLAEYCPAARIDGIAILRACAGR
jgi:hypothetical protein